MQWQRNNREKTRKIFRKWAESHRDEYLARRRSKPELNAQHSRNRRARKLVVGGQHTVADIAAILQMQKGCCAYCRKRLQSKWHVDHIVPLSKGGANDRKNLQLTCAKCNQEKGAKHPLAFAKQLGLLL